MCIDKLDIGEDIKLFAKLFANADRPTLTVAEATERASKLGVEVEQLLVVNTLSECKDICPEASDWIACIEEDLDRLLRTGEV